MADAAVATACAPPAPLLLLLLLRPTITRCDVPW
jgi:hypothetical protein